MGFDLAAAAAADPSHNKNNLPSNKANSSTTTVTKGGTPKGSGGGDKFKSGSAMGKLVAAIGAVEGAVEHCHEHVERSTFRRWGASMARGHWSLLHRKPQAARPHHQHDHDKKASSSGGGGSDALATSGGSGHEHEHEHEDLTSKPPPSRSSLVLTVSVDAFVDGFLIGLCAVSSKTTAYIMAAATALEMGFLGLAYGSVLRGDLAAHRSRGRTGSLDLSSATTRTVNVIAANICPLCLNIFALLRQELVDAEKKQIYYPHTTVKFPYNSHR